MNNHKELEFKLYGFMIQLLDIFKGMKLDSEEIQKITDVIELIHIRKYKVAVVGEFKRGKSSLINALLGMKVLPSDVTPTTATINRITYGTEPSLEIHFHNGAVKIVDISDIGQYVTMLTEEAKECAAQIKEAVVRYPTVLCQNHVDIIDTPGLSDHYDMSKITLDMLEDIDAAIVVISALSPFGDTECKFVIDLIEKDNIENIMFVVTYIDQIDESERDQFISKIYKRICDNVYKLLNDKTKKDLLELAKKELSHTFIFGVSSTMALKSFLTGDRNLLEQSRYETFKTELYKNLTSQQGLNTLSKSIKTIINSCNHFDVICPTMIMAYQNKIENIDYKISCLKDNSIRYKKQFRDVLVAIEMTAHKSSTELFKYKNKFLERLTHILDNNTDKDSTVNALELVAMDCSNEADQQGKVLSVLFVNQLYIGLNELIEERRSIILSHTQFLSEVETNLLKAYDYTHKDLEEIFESFGTPMFHWQASPIPVKNLYESYHLLNNAIHAVDVSVQTFFNHWNIFFNAVIQWWMKRLENEILELQLKIEKDANVEKRRLQNELANLSVLYENKTKNIDEIRQNVKAIYELIEVNYE